ncbi:unnamed protein product [Brugia timori]|uniref:Uncharacterized protein n=1 Tax=Brugia timori TaxID=42155 RepID=A0A0R3QA98_9BILA|nr:unnamed protein product [Brugia timori]
MSGYFDLNNRDSFKLMHGFLVHILRTEKKQTINFRYDFPINLKISFSGLFLFAQYSAFNCSIVIDSSNAVNGELMVKTEADFGSLFRSPTFKVVN